MVQRRRIAVLGVLTVIALGYLLWFTPFLGVSTVEVVGVREVEADRVRSVADVPIDHPMVRVDTDRVAARVSELPGVAEADVSRSWPSTITITVTERRAVAYHESSGGVELVDSTGVLFEHLDAPPDGLPKLDLLDPGPAHDETRAVTAVLAALPTELFEQVVSATAVTPGSVELELTEERVVRWGDAEQNEYKAKVLDVLLTRKGSAYDVSSPELPTVS